MKTGHVVLLGDSIFDNAVYVRPGPDVITQLQRCLEPTGWKASKEAVDGNITTDVLTQLKRLPADTTHLVVSAGGNDALQQAHILGETTGTVRNAMSRLADMRDHFRERYQAMVQALRRTGKLVAVCTIYESMPDLAPVLGPPERAALAIFNDVILCEAFRARLPVIDLRLVCEQPSDYAASSPIEPSAQGGEKIVREIAEFLTTYDFTQRRSVIYS